MTEFSTHEEKLRAIQSKIYLKTKMSFTQQEIFNFAYKIMEENIDTIVHKIYTSSIKPSTVVSDKNITRATDFNKSKENVSPNSNILYSARDY